jgi:citrate lyase beta subunit
MDLRLISCPLFVPGDRPDRFAKAEAAGADAVVFDLEDAVAPARKHEARAQVLDYLSKPNGTPHVARVVRLNRIGSLDGVADLSAFVARGASADFAMLPKVESAAEVQLAAAQLSPGGKGAGLIALIESARGLENAPSIATASPQLKGMAFGGADLSAELGAVLTWDAMLYGRGRLVAAAALGGLAVLDVPYLDIKDTGGLTRECIAGRRMGFTGKIAIHPSQVAPIVAAFAPTQDEIDRAHRVIAASDAVQGGVGTIDGRMIDAPVVNAARRVLALAERALGRAP